MSSLEGKLVFHQRWRSLELHAYTELLMLAAEKTKEVQKLQTRQYLAQINSTTIYYFYFSTF